MRIISLLLVTCFFGTLQAQTASDSVRQVVSHFFSAMRKSDTATMRSCLSPLAHLEATQEVPDAEPRLIPKSVDDFFASIARIEPGLLDERIEFASICVDGSLASVWTPYTFYFNGRYSHCGVNSFQLVRVRQQWQIQYLIDTRHKTCPDKSGSK
jgi:hypothetical protein